MHAFAALAGVQDIWPCSLREIIWRAEARRMSEWNHTAWICAHQPRYSSERLEFADFHPLLKEKKLSPEAQAAANAAARKTLRKNVTDEQREALWRELDRRMAE